MSKNESQREADVRVGEAVYALGRVITRLHEKNADHEAYCERLRVNLPDVIITLEALAMKSFTASSSTFSNN